MRLDSRLLELGVYNLFSVQLLNCMWYIHVMPLNGVMIADVACPTRVQACKLCKVLSALPINLLTSFRTVQELMDASPGLTYIHQV